MGHSVAVVKVEQNEYDPKKQSTSPYYRTTREDELISLAVQNWQWLDDHDRNGSPSMSRGHVLPAMPEELAGNVAAEKTDRDQNIIIPLISKNDYTIKQKTITVKLNDAEWKQYTKGYGWGVIEKKIEETNPELAGKITHLLRVKPEGSDRYDDRAGWTVRSTVDADTSGGKAKTQYYLVGDKLYKDRKGIKYFDSQAEARAWAVTVMDNDPLINNVSVEARVRREDGSSVVKLTRKVSSATAKFTVSYVHMKTTTPKTDGWLVGFDYHT